MKKIIDSAPPAQRDRLLSFGLAAAVLLVLFRSMATTVADPDLWGYLAFGRLFWHGDGFPYRDPFSYVPTLDPWVYHEWLTGVLFYPIYTRVGDQGLQVLKYLLGFATVALIYCTARRRGANPPATWFLLFAAQGFLALGYSPVRAQIFTYFFFALSLYLLETARQTGRWGRLLVLVPVHVAWCNLHGGFLAGLGLLGLYAFGECVSRRRFLPYALVFLSSAAATLINPYGLRYWAYLAEAIPMEREITEWASLAQAYRGGLMSGWGPLYVLIAAVFAALLAVQARWRDLTGGIVTACTFTLGVTHVRHLVFFLICLGVYMPALLTAYLDEARSRPRVAAAWQRAGRRLAGVALAGLLAGSAFKLLGVHDPLRLELPACPKEDGKGGMYYPLGAMDYIEAYGLSGDLLIHFDWGEYALWRLYPRCRVAIDGRYETVYPQRTHKSYFDFLSKRRDWDRFLEEYPPDMILIKNRSAVQEALAGSEGWRQVFSDCGSALFVRKGDPGYNNGRFGPRRQETRPHGKGL